MDTIFLYAAVLGGTVLVLQTVLMLFGVGGEADVDVGLDTDTAMGSAAADAAQLSLLKVLTFKGVVAFLTFFGLTGMLARSLEFESMSSLTLGIVAGLVSMFLVAWLMASLTQLQASGSLDLHNAVGASARVYLRVPPGGAPGGRVHVTVQGRRVECRAVTPDGELPVGTEVQVVGVVGTDVLEVRARG